MPPPQPTGAQPSLTPASHSQHRTGGASGEMLLCLYPKHGQKFLGHVGFLPVGDSIPQTPFHHRVWDMRSKQLISAYPSVSHDYLKGTHTFSGSRDWECPILSEHSSHPGLSRLSVQLQAEWPAPLNFISFELTFHPRQQASNMELPCVTSGAGHRHLHVCHTKLNTHTRVQVQRESE